MARAGWFSPAALVLVITSDRGLCGPYNGSILRAAMKHLRTLDDYNLEVVGRKGQSVLKFNKFAIDAAQSLFVQNAEEHLHSLIAPDLGMGPWRNSIILKAITGREYYPIERSVAFQTFGGQ